MSVQLSLLPDAPSLAEVVYYATDMCHVKIGRTVDPRRRGGELHVEMLHTIPGGQLDERRAHRMWAAYRIGRSEWFRASDELLLWLTVELARAGAPARRLAILSQLIVNNKTAVAA